MKAAAVFPSDSAFASLMSLAMKGDKSENKGKIIKFFVLSMFSLVLKTVEL